MYKPLEINGKWTGCDYCDSVDCDGKECRKDSTQKPEPIAICKKCNNPVYTKEGFCSICEPKRL